MLTASCPKCEKQVTVPAAARPESRVRCPLCSEEYSLEGIFAELPPLLVLLDAPAASSISGSHGAEPIVAASASSVGGSSSIFDFGEREREDAAEQSAESDTAVALADPVEVAPQTHAFDFTGGASPADDAASAAPRTMARPRAKKKASPVKSLIGVVVGGLVALPMAQLILWYLPGGWDVEKRDPMGIGRSYPNSFGLLAPSWVKGEPVAADDSAQHEPSPPDPVQPPPADQQAKLDPEGSSLGRDDLNSALVGGNTKPPAGDEEPPPIIDDGAGGGEETVPPVEEPDVEEPAPVKSPVKDAPTFTTAELGNELKIAKEAQGLIDTAVQPTVAGAEKKAAAEAFLQAMSALARVVTFAQERPAGHLEHVTELVAAASDTEQKRKIVSTLATLEIAKSDREQHGTIFMGTVTEIQQRGELFETVIETATSAKKPISVYTADDPQSSIAVGNVVAVLGVIVDEPNQNLAGYKGEPDPIVWGGYWQVVPE